MAITQGGSHNRAAHDPYCELPIDLERIRMLSLTPDFAHFRLFTLVFCLLSYTWVPSAIAMVLDDFEELSDWNVTTSEGVDLEIAQDEGHTGMAMRLDFDFHNNNAGGFVIAHKPLPISMPANFSFSFYIRGDAAANNFEFKIIDPSGQNVWWFKRRNFEFPKNWEKITIKKRHIDFAWGTADRELNEAAAIEFAISAGEGQKGSVWIDRLNFEERDEQLEPQTSPQIRASTTAAGYEPTSIFDKDPETAWKSGSIAEGQWLQLDFKYKREYGGLIIDWGPANYAEAYEILVSDDGQNWKRVYSVDTGNGGRDYIYLPDSESEHLRIDLQRSSRGQGYSILDIDIRPYQFSSSPNHLFEAIARDSIRGIYPRYLYGEQAYWTIVGVNGDSKEALINEEGMVEIEKAGFSLEPFLHINDQLVTWNDVKLSQELDNRYLPIPSVNWDYQGLKLKVTAFAAGEPEASSLYLRYRVTNDRAERVSGKLFLALRPFQVNPPWQSLNMMGGMGEIKEMYLDGGVIHVNNNRKILTLMAADRFGTVDFAQGDITDFLYVGTLPKQTTVFDDNGYASGALEYSLDILPGGMKDIYLIAPFHNVTPLMPANPTTDSLSRLWTSALEDTREDWKSILNRMQIELPHTAYNEKIIDTLKSTLAYILINRDGAALQPGSRSYERSWIRDGAITSAALMSMGHTQEARDFIEWYAGYQYNNGKVPCCVDARGADSVPEHDSLGQWIYLIMEYYRFTHDTGFLTKMWPRVVQTVEYIEHLRRQRTTEAYLKPEKSVLYGLIPESISHEGYSSNPVHSYWDDFFVLRGLKDAARIAEILGEDEYAENFRQIRDTFSKDLFESINRSVDLHGVDYIPGAAELGDYDPAATTVAIDPLGALNDLPPAALQGTFDNYYEILKQRQRPDFQWKAYSPYEVRTVGTFVRLGQQQRAHEALKFFMQGQRPAVWNQWGEVVWRDRNATRFIGDMPHTWVGADYIRSIRSLFVYERDSDQALILAAGIDDDWVRNGKGVTVKRLPTHYGTLNYSVKIGHNGSVKVHMSGDITLPPGKIVLHSPLSAPIRGVSVNGHDIREFSPEQVVLDKFPADVILHY